VVDHNLLFLTRFDFPFVSKRIFHGCCIFLKEKEETSTTTPVLRGNMGEMKVVCVQTYTQKQGDKNTEL
jgi:hypothetical protein